MHLQHASTLILLAGALLLFTLGHASSAEAEDVQIADAPLWLDHWADYQKTNKATLTEDQAAVFDLAKDFLQNPSEELDARLISAAKKAFGSQTARDLFATRPQGPEEGDESGNNNDDGENGLAKRQLGCASGCHCSTKSNYCDDDLPCIYNPADDFGCHNWHVNACGSAVWYPCDGRCGTCPSP